jgi:hypothetical protein
VFRYSVPHKPHLIVLPSEASTRQSHCMYEWAPFLIPC